VRSDENDGFSYDLFCSDKTDTIELDRIFYEKFSWDLTGTTQCILFGFDSIRLVLTDEMEKVKSC